MIMHQIAKDKGARSTGTVLTVDQDIPYVTTGCGIRMDLIRKKLQELREVVLDGDIGLIDDRDV